MGMMCTEAHYITVTNLHVIVLYRCYYSTVTVFFFHCFITLTSYHVLFNSSCYIQSDSIYSYAIMATHWPRTVAITANVSGQSADPDPSVQANG